MTARRSRRVYLVVTGAWLVVIGYSSIGPTPFSAGPSVPWAPIVVHLGGYAVLGVLVSGLLGAFAGKRVKLLLMAGVGWVFATTYGIAMELSQLAVPGRYADLDDLGWNALGAGLGGGLGLLATWRAARRARQPEAGPKGTSTGP